MHHSRDHHEADADPSPVPRDGQFYNDEVESILNAIQSLRPRTGLRDLFTRLRPITPEDVDSVILQITNESRERIMLKSFKLGEPLLSRTVLMEPIGVDAKDIHRRRVHVPRTAVTDHEASARQPIARFTAEITYTVAGQTWTRVSNAPARLAQTQGDSSQS